MLEKTALPKQGGFCFGKGGSGSWGFNKFNGKGGGFAAI